MDELVGGMPRRPSERANDTHRQRRLSFAHLQTRLTTRPHRYAAVLTAAPLMLLALLVLGILVPYQGSGLAADPQLAEDSLHGPETLGARWQPLIFLGTAALLLVPPVLLGVGLLSGAYGLVLATHPRSRRRTWLALLPVVSIVAVVAAGAEGPLADAGAWLLG